MNHSELMFWENISKVTEQLLFFLLIFKIGSPGFSLHTHFYGLALLCKVRTACNFCVHFSFTSFSHCKHKSFGICQQLRVDICQQLHANS